jgi:hypothetical protein
VPYNTKLFDKFAIMAAGMGQQSEVRSFHTQVYMAGWCYVDSPMEVGLPAGTPVPVLSVGLEAELPATP